MQEWRKISPSLMLNIKADDRESLNKMVNWQPFWRVKYITS